MNPLNWIAGKSHWLGSLVLLLMILSIQAAAQAETLEVCADGSCAYDQIQDAIDDAQDGDVIRVGPGVWTGADGSGSVIDPAGKAITIESTEGPANTILDGEGLR